MRGRSWRSKPIKVNKRTDVDPNSLPALGWRVVDKALSACQDALNDVTRETRWADPPTKLHVQQLHRKVNKMTQQAFLMMDTGTLDPEDIMPLKRGIDAVTERLEQLAEDARERRPAFPSLVNVKTTGKRRWWWPWDGLRDEIERKWVGRVEMEIGMKWPKVKRL